MMFASPVGEYEINPEIVKRLNQLLILHADHEQNCVDLGVKLVASTGVIFTRRFHQAFRHSGAIPWRGNQAVIEMLELIRKDRRQYKKYVEKAKSNKEQIQTHGFGHAVYKNYDLGQSS